MTSRVGGEPKENSRLRQMIFLSAALHVLVIGWIIVTGYFKRTSEPPSVAYTVELVNPAAIGSNLPSGSKNGSLAEAEPKAPPKPAPPPAPPPQEAKPAVPTVQEEKKPPPPVQQKEQVKIVEKEKPVEPPVKPAPEKVKVEEKIPAVKKPEPKPEPPKIAKVEEPKPEPKKPELKKPEAKVEKVEPEKPPPKKPEERQPEPKPAETKPPKVEAKPDKPPTKPEKEPEKPAEQKPPVKTVEKPAEEKATKGDAVQPEDRDRQIAAALERIKARVQPKGEDGGDSEGVKGSGPVTKGGEAGQGGGGVVRGLDFILYTQQLQRRVQESWIVAEKKPGLLAAVSFKIQTDGGVQEVELTKSSGDNAFDQSVLRAVRKAAPFPPPPQTYAEEFATQKIVMNFGGEGRVN